MAGVSGQRRRRLGVSGWELLVIALIVATLTALAVPIFMGQARGAKDDATEADALGLDSAIRTAYDQVGHVTSVTTEDGWHMINGAQVLEASPGVEVAHFVGASATSWCVELRHSRGDIAATDGVRVLAGTDEAEYGTCVGHEAADAAGGSALAPGSHQVGPWVLSVLSTDRDAGELLGQGNHPDGFRQVLSTLLVTNTSDTVQDVSMLEFLFGASGGSGHGYTPGDDWCAFHELDYTAFPTVMFPGQSRVVTTCVPVDPVDADGLAMWVRHGDTTVPGGPPIEIALPADDEETEPPAFDDFPTVHARMLEHAGREGMAFGYTFRVEDVTVTPGDEGRSRVRVTVDTGASGETSDNSPQHFVVGPNGNHTSRDICTPGEFPPPLDGQPWRYDFCFTVPEDEAHDLLLVIADWYNSPDAVTLDARPF